MSLKESVKGWLTGKMGNDWLENICDHPRVNVSASELVRIEDNLRYFEGDFPERVYRNSYGRTVRRPRLGLNMAKLVCRRLSSLIFNAQMTFRISDGDRDFEINRFAAADAFVREVFARTGFLEDFERQLESCMALGGLGLRPYVSEGAVAIATVQALNFFPLGKGGAVLLTKTSRREGNLDMAYTLLEFHERAGGAYRVSHELSRAEGGAAIGQRVPLSRLYPGLQETTSIKGLSRPLWVYLTPFGLNNLDLSSPLGLSLYDNAKGTLRQINETFDAFHQEVQSGKRRIAVTEEMLRERTDAQGHTVRYFDEAESVYVNTGDAMEGAKISDLTSPIRSDDYISALNYFIKTLEMALGLSAGSFSFDGTGVKTATEVVTENAMTYQTRNSHLANVSRALKELMISILELAAGTIGPDGQPLFVGERPTMANIRLDFDSGVFFDKASEQDYYLKGLGTLYSRNYVLAKLGVSMEEREERRSGRRWGIARDSGGLGSIPKIPVGRG